MQGKRAYLGSYQHWQDYSRIYVNFRAGMCMCMYICLWYDVSRVVCVCVWALRVFRLTTGRFRISKCRRMTRNEARPSFSIYTRISFKFNELDKPWKVRLKIAKCSIYFKDRVLYDPRIVFGTRLIQWRLLFSYR